MDFKEQNKIIARFLRWEEQTDPTEKFFGEWFDTKGVRRTFRDSEVLLFHSDWNWLMDLVAKIENTRTLENDGYYDVTIFSDAVFITKEFNREDLIIINKSEVVGSLNHEVIIFEDKILAVYYSCLLFIEYYNKNLK